MRETGNSDSIEADILVAVTRAVRRADEDFQGPQGGGSSRHWVRDWFIPYIRQEGFEIVPRGSVKDDMMKVLLSERE